jgi:hypothetical protein
VTPDDVIGPVIVLVVVLAVLLLLDRHIRRP